VQGDGWEKRLPVNFGLARDDVESAFPAAQRGVLRFRGHRLLAAQPVAALIWSCDSTMARCWARRYARPGIARGGHRKFHELLWLARAGLAPAEARDIEGIVIRAKAQNYSAPSLDDLDVVGRLLPELSGDRRVSVVFDHNLGGGANQYRRALIDERLSGGVAVLLCTYNLPTLDYRSRCSAGRGEEIYRISSFSAWSGY